MKVTLTPYTRRHFTCKAATFLTPAQTLDLHELENCEFKSVKKNGDIAVWYQRRQFIGRIHDKCSQLILNLRTLVAAVVMEAAAENMASDWLNSVYINKWQKNWYKMQHCMCITYNRWLFFEQNMDYILKIVVSMQHLMKLTYRNFADANIVNIKMTTWRHNCNCNKKVPQASTSRVL